MLEHREMLVNFNDASSSTEMNDACLADIKRFFINGQWWTGDRGKQFKNKPKPEFNKLWRSINRICGDINDMELNATIVSNSDDATDEDADLLARRWRNDFQSSDGVEASEIATMEAIVGGFGCTKTVSKYEDEENPDPNKQYLCSEIIHSACTSVVFDAGAIRKDKKDSRWGWHIIRTNRKKVEADYGVDIVSFMGTPSRDNSNPISYNSTRDVYLAHYYEVIERTLTVYDMSELNGVVITKGDGIKDQEGNEYSNGDLKDILAMYAEFTGEEVQPVKKKEKYVEYSICDGEKYLDKPQRMPFDRIPLYPRYGYYKVIDGQEFFCGEVRKQIDSEMFYNSYGSSLMEIMSLPQNTKPEYTPEQIMRHAAQRARADIDNAPFILSDPIKSPDGTPIHFGPIGMSQPPQIGSGMATAGQFLSENIMQMGAIGNATVPANASGEAIQQVNERQDDAFLPIVKNVLHSIRAQCEGWIPAAKKLYFTNQRRLRVQESDGKYTQVTTLEMVEDEDGNYGPFKNSARGSYTVQVKKGESYKNQREAERESVVEMLQYAGTDTEFGQLMLMNAMTLTSGEGGDNMRSVARYKTIDLMLSMQIPFKPENEEEELYIQNKIQQIQQQQQQQQQNNPALLMAQAEMLKGQADMLEQQNRQAEIQIQMGKAQADIQGKQYKQMTDDQLNYVKSMQEQEKIDNKAFDDMQKNKIAWEKMKKSCN